MNIDKYVSEVKIDNNGLTINLIDNTTHILHDQLSGALLIEYIKNNFHTPTVLEGWLGGDYDHLGFFDSKEDADRGYLPTERMWDLIPEEFKGKKVRIIIEEIE